jgi:hypothetical protein
VCSFEHYRILIRSELQFCDTCCMITNLHLKHVITVCSSTNSGQESRKGIGFYIDFFNQIINKQSNQWIRVMALFIKRIDIFVGKSSDYILSPSGGIHRIIRFGNRLMKSFGIEAGTYQVGSH